MKVIFCLIFIFSVFQYPKVFSQPTDSTEVFLLTSFPGKTIETIYGHSAIRVVNHYKGIDEVYSWGVYDPRTRFFVYKFGAGRLKYQIDSISFDRFLYGYFLEHRSVICQKINYNKSESEILIDLINKNLQPEMITLIRSKLTIANCF